jgi:hypothetical protein
MLRRTAAAPAYKAEIYGQLGPGSSACCRTGPSAPSQRSADRILGPVSQVAVGDVIAAQIDRQRGQVREGPHDMLGEVRLKRQRLREPQRPPVLGRRLPVGANRGRTVTASRTVGGIRAAPELSTSLMKNGLPPVFR